MYFVYFLLLSDSNVYKGMANDLKRRLDEHQNGKVKSTQYKRPLLCVGYEAYLLKSDALRREKFLKTTEGRRLLKMQYRDILQSRQE